MTHFARTPRAVALRKNGGRTPVVSFKALSIR